MVSLNELLRMEEQRRRDVVDAERARVAHLERERHAAECRERADEEQRRAANEARRRDSALRAAVEGAQIDAAKSTQIEKTRLEMLVRMQADEIAARDVHTRELTALVDHLGTGRGRVGTIVVAALAVVAVGACVAMITARRQPVAPPPVINVPPDPSEATSELELTRKKIAALEEDLRRLRAAQPSVAPNVIAPKPARPPMAVVPAVPAVKEGARCPPGIKGIPMCP